MQYLGERLAQRRINVFSVTIEVPKGKTLKSLQDIVPIYIIMEAFPLRMPIYKRLTYPLVSSLIMHKLTAVKSQLVTLKL